MTDTDRLWGNDTPISEYTDIDVPEWLGGDKISAYDVAAIVQGGCASGAWMPAVTYYTATKIMAEHGNDVLQYIEDAIGELPAPPKGSSWSGISVHYLSWAVEMWAAYVEPLLMAELE